MTAKKPPTSPTPVDREPTDPPATGDPRPVIEAVADGPLHEEETSAGLTDRQRTRMEKRDQAVADVGEDKDTSKCDNHPDREAVVVTDGVLHSVQALCEECATQNGFALPSPE